MGAIKTRAAGAVMGQTKSGVEGIRRMERESKDSGVTERRKKEATDVNK